MKGLAGPLEPGIACEKHFQHGGNQGLGFLFSPIGVGIDRRVILEGQSKIGVDREREFDRCAVW